MPPAAMIHAMIAPNGPVAMPKVRGSEKMPEPTIEPTTIPVSANSDSFWTEFEFIWSSPPAGELARDAFSSRHAAFIACCTCEQTEATTPPFPANLAI